MDQKRILIVEDELIIAADIERILKKQDWEVIAVSSCAKEALNQIDRLTPDMVLIDINLSGQKEGIDVGRYLLEKDTIPFVYITSSVDKITLEEAKQTRPMGYIVKPFRPNDIVTTMEIAFSNHRHRKLDPNRNTDNPTSEIPYRLRKITDYIHNNLNNKFSIDDLAGQTDWKPHHFIRNFKKYLGVTPYQYILQCKIQKAKALLAETDLLVSNIGYDLGFQSHSSFTTTFYKLTNETPEVFRIKRKQNLL